MGNELPMGLQAANFIDYFSDYLLSNNHVNSIIVHRFDFSDEEVMAYYISFLKTLSFRLNKHTIHFFYNEVSILPNGSIVYDQWLLLRRDF